MSTVNSFALWGTLAGIGVAVPIIIHLLHQRHRRRTDWAAMELLRKALVIRSGQVKLEDLLILLLRCLVLALAAFAMLRPFLDSDSSIIPGEKKAGMVVAIDASYSMSHGKHAQRFDRAKEKALQILKNANVGDPTTVVLLGQKPRILLRGVGYEETRFNEVINGASTLPEAMNLDRCLDEVAELVAELKAPLKECYLVTDGQAVDWENISQDARASLDSVDGEATIFVAPIADEGSENLSVMNFQYASGSLVPSGTIRFEAEVRNHGAQIQDGATAVLQVDGQDVSRQSVGPIRAGESKVVAFYTSFDGGGDARVRVELSADSLNQDNARQTVVHVRDRIRVLCAHGEGPSGSKPSEIFYLVRALELKKSQESTSLDVVRADWQDLDTEDFNDYDVILLANVPTIGVDLAQRLDRFVRKGGGLGIYGGDKLDLDSYNAQLYGEEVSLLPGELTGMAEFEGSGLEENQDEASWTIGPIQSDHVLAKLAASIPEEGRNAAKIRKVLQVKPDASADTLLTLSRKGLPLLLEKRVGAGTVLLVTTTADRDWGNLCVHPFFPMMAQQSITHFTSRPGERTYTVGVPGEVSFTGLQADASVTLAEPESDPRGVSLSVRDDGGVFCSVDTEVPGFYEVQPEGQSSSALAVNILPSEADVKVLPSDALGSALGKPEWVVPLDANLEQLIKQSREGLDISRTLLILALVVFLLQGFLARLFTSRMSGDDATDVTESLRKQTLAAARRTT